MNPQWKSNLSLIHKRVHSDAGTAQTRATEEKRVAEPKLTLNDAVGDMLQFGLKDNSVAFIDPALASFDAGTPRYNPSALLSASNQGLSGSASRSAHAARGAGGLFSPPGKASNRAGYNAMESTLGWDTSHITDTDVYLRGNDTIDMTNVGDASFDRLDANDGEVIMGSGSGEGNSRFNSDKGSNDSAMEFNVIPDDYERRRSNAAAAARDSSMYSMGSEEKYANDSQINTELAYEPLHKSYSDHENSTENAFSGKKLDFGSSLENATGMLAKHIAHGKEDDSKMPTTPPREDRSMPMGDVSDMFRPSSSACPSSPDLKHTSVVYNKTPSRIPVSTGKSGSTTRISPTQDRSTSKFADALRRKDEEDKESPETVAQGTPQQTSKGSVAETPAGASARPPATPQFTPARSNIPQSQRSAPTPERAILSVEQFDVLNADANGYDEWKEAWTPVGKKYFYNRKTRKSAWRLPQAAVLVQMAPNHVKIFVPRQAESLADKMDLTVPVTRADAAAATTDAVMSQTAGVPQTRTPLAGKDVNSIVTPSVSANKAKSTQEPVNSAGRGKEDLDWGNTRQTFTRTAISDKVSSTPLVPIAEVTSRPSTAVEATSTPAKTPLTKASSKSDIGSAPVTVSTTSRTADATTVERTRYSGLSSGAKTTQVDEAKRKQPKESTPMDCETLLFCPLCADVVIPIDFPKHMKTCPEISHLINNGEWKIALGALESGLKALTLSLSELARAPAPKGTSPLPTKALTFEVDDGRQEENDQEETYQDGEEYDEDFEEEQNHTMLHNNMSHSVSNNKCAFCAKECSKSALSAHLLVCKVRKQMRLKHQKAVEESAKKGASSAAPQRFGSAPADARRTARAGIAASTPERAATAGEGSAMHSGGKRTSPQSGPSKTWKSNSAKFIPKAITTTRVFM